MNTLDDGPIICQDMLDAMMTATEMPNLSQGIRFRCDACGRFIGMNEFDHRWFKPHATHRIITPSSYRSREEWETLCRVHSGNPDFRPAKSVGD